ncbi:MAG: hypothetical protein H8E62_07560 [Planctomycetes bacterium]|nr:hypothetical protein [Planctomycetota bacterium]
MAFCTMINCMDGRVQLPVINYLMERFGVEYVDSITEPGPAKILAEQTDQALLDSIFHRVSISTDKHGSKSITICAHADCAGNPVDDDTQKEQLKKATVLLKTKYPDIKVLTLWLDINRDIYEL